MSQPVLPQRARVVVVGGGIIGCSVAYHLAHMGWKDVVLLERDRLTSGTTWHAAGLMVTFGSTSETSTEMRKYTRDLYARLEAETGLVDRASSPSASSRSPPTHDRLEEYRRVSAFNRYCGVDVHEISPRAGEGALPARAHRRHPRRLLREGGRAREPRRRHDGAGEGRAHAGREDPRGRAGHGRPPEARRRHRRAARALGDIEAEYVVNCAGMWARQLGAKAGVNIPLQSAEHYYLITEKIPGLSPRRSRARGSGVARLLPRGGRRAHGRPLRAGVRAVEGRAACPRTSPSARSPPDWDRMGPYVETAMKRVPISLEAGIRKFFCGPESFTPDLQPIVGEAPELKNYFVAAGLNSIGILTGGGLGRVLAHWIINGRPDVDVTGLQHRSPAHLPVEPRVPPHAHRRVARHGLPVPLPDALDADRARREELSGPRPPRRARRVLPRRERLGGRRLVRAAGRRARRPSALSWGRQQLVSRTGRPSTRPRARA